jgi:putative multiple sugar transport system permease protein
MTTTASPARKAPESAPGPGPRTSGASGVLSYLRGQFSQIGLFIALIAIVVFFQVTTGGVTLQPDNVSNLINQNSYILILAVGMVMVIIAGHIDLSVGSVVAFIGALAGVMITRWGLPWPAAVLLCLVVGALVGAWQGYWVAYFGVR